MKKFFVLILAFFMFSLASCRFSDEPGFRFYCNADTNGGGNVLYIGLSLKSKIHNRADGDCNVVLYNGPSVFSYVLRYEDEIISSFNTEPTSERRSVVLGPVWSPVETYSEVITLDRIGNYTLDAKASFIYEYSGVEFNYTETVDFEVQEIKDNVNNTVPNDFSFEFFAPYSTYNSQSGTYMSSGINYSIILNSEELLKIYKIISENDLYNSPSEIYFNSPEGFYGTSSIYECIFRFTVKGTKKSISLYYYTDSTSGNEQDDKVANAILEIISFISLKMNDKNRL